MNSEKINIQNFSINTIQSNLNNTLNNLKNYTKINKKININLSNQENNNKDNNNKDNNDNKNNRKINISYKTDVFSLMNQLGEVNICPFYYFSNLIREGTADIIVATFKDFFDPKQRIKITNLISKENKSQYKIIFDECGDFENLIVDYFSFQIDNNILQFASDQLFKLQEINNTNINLIGNNSKNGDIEMKKDNLNNNNHKEIYDFENFNFMENEFIELNGFTRNFLGNYIILF